jgi:hypothetical protein
MTASLQLYSSDVGREPNLERNTAKEARKERYGGDEPKINARESAGGRQESNETKGESIIRRSMRNKKEQIKLARKQGRDGMTKSMSPGRSDVGIPQRPKVKRRTSMVGGEPKTTSSHPRSSAAPCLFQSISCPYLTGNHA